MQENLSFVNDYHKEKHYNVYVTIATKPKDYNKITRKQMVLAIYNHIKENPTWLEYYLSEEELTFFIAVANGLVEYKNPNEKDRNMLFKLTSQFLMNYEYESEIFISEVIKDTIINYKITKNHQKMDQFYYFILGLLLTRGRISVDEAKEIYEKVRPKYFNLDFLTTLYKLSRFVMNIDYYLLKEEQVIAFNSKIPLPLADYEPIFKYTWQMYLSLGKYKINREIKQIDELYLLLNKDEEQVSTFKYLLPGLIYSVQLQKDFFYKLVFDNIKDALGDEDEAMQFFQEVLSLMPLWAFKGDCAQSVNEAPFRTVKQEIYCSCGSGKLPADCCEDEELLFKNKAILSAKRSEEFYNLLQMLLFLTNLKYNVNRYKFFPEFTESLTSEEYIKLKDFLLEDLNIVREYISINKKVLTPSKVEILVGLLNNIKGDFIAVEYENQKLVVYDQIKKRKYIVGGINSPICELISDDDLPAYVTTRLIPLNDRIIYDVFFTRIDVVKNQNLIEKIKNELLKTKNYTSIKDF